MTTRNFITYLMIALPLFVFLGVFILVNGVKLGIGYWIISLVVSLILLMLMLAVMYFLPKNWIYTLDKTVKKNLKSEKNVQSPRKKRGA